MCTELEMSLRARASGCPDAGKARSPRLPSVVSAREYPFLQEKCQMSQRVRASDPSDASVWHAGYSQRLESAKPEQQAEP
jgi:hypothetical protein